MRQSAPVQRTTLPGSLGPRGGLPPIQSIVHIQARVGLFGEASGYIEDLSGSLLRAGASSSLVYEELHGAMPGNLSSSIEVPGLASRQRVGGLVERVLRTIAAIDPDLVYVHEIFDGRILRALDGPRRSYAIVWHVHDYYPTCLTGLRAHSGRSSVCLEPLSTKCLSKIDSGCCTKEEPAASYSYFDLAARIELLRSARYADAVIVAGELMRRLLIGNHPDIAKKVYRVRYPVEGHTARAGELESLADVIRQVRRPPRY